MSLTPIHDDPFELLNSDDPKKVKLGLIMLRALAITGDSKADDVLGQLEAAECPDEPDDAAHWVIRNRTDVAREAAREKKAGCVGLLVVMSGLTATAMWVVS